MSAQWPLTARAATIERLGRAYTAGSTGGVVLTGPAGVGKTRLGEELLARAGGRPTARAVGHTATQAIPLGALAHLLPTEIAREIGIGDDERASLFHRARAAIAELAGHDRLLLLVDDVDQLDDTSLALLLPLALQRTVFLVATIRLGRPMPSVIATLAKDGHLTVEDVAPLDHDGIVTLLHRVLDGPVETVSGERLALVSEGNLQVLHEVVQLGRQRGTLRVEHGVWRLTEVPVPRALDELIRSRLGALVGTDRRAIDLLAVAGSLLVDDLVALAGAEAVTGLERSQVIRTAAVNDQWVASLAHPMYGEVLRSELSGLTERELKRDLADLFESRAASTPDDLSRLAAWRLDSGGDVDAGVLLAAGRLALMGRDVGSARRFASAAAVRGAAHDAARISVEAAVLGNDPGAVESAVAAVWDDVDLPDGHRAHLARRLALTRFALTDHHGALAVTEQAAARVREPAAIAAVQAQRAEILASMGRPVDALAVLDSVPTDDVEPRVLAQRCTARSMATLSIGRFADAIEAARTGAAAQAALPEWLARRGAAAHLVNEAHAYGYSGRFAEARALVEPALASAIDAGALAAQVWFRIVLGEIWRDAGYGTRCLEQFRIAVDLAEPAGQRASLVWSWVGVAQGHLLRGEVEPAAEALAGADDVGDSPIAASWGTKERTRAWLMAARGDLAAARRLLIEVADAAAADGMFNFESGPRHDLVRFGDPSAGAVRLTELEHLVEGPWVRALASHARAAAGDDPAGLDDALAQFEAIDSVTLAAEVALDLAAAHRRRGDGRSAAAAERRAAALVARAGGAGTPGLQRGAAVVPLTAREHEIALLARAGHTSAEIATQLIVSVRTVDTHLARVYRKLGITGRDGLDSALSSVTSRT